MCVRPSDSGVSAVVLAVMGRKKKSSSGPTDADDNALLDAAIAEVAALRAGETVEETVNHKALAKANRALRLAGRDGDLSAIKQALERGADAHELVSIDEAEYTLLIALFSFDYDLAEKLVAGGFPLTCSSSGPLLNIFCQRPTMAQLFGKEDDDDEQEEHVYSNRATVEFLLKHGADPSLKHRGSAPMFPAIWNSDIDGPDEDGEIVRMLLQARVDPNEPLTDDSREAGSPGCLALSYAAQIGNARVVRLLLAAGAEIDGQPPYEAMDMMTEACLWIGSDEAKEKELQRNLETATALFSAGRSKQYAIVGLLLNRRADPNIPLRNGLTPLVDAISQFDNASDAGWEAGLLHVRLLIRAKARLDAGPDGAWSPLIEAIKKPAAHMAELLLDAGAPIDEALQRAEKCACGCYGDPAHGPPTPLSVASARGLEAIVEMLIDRRAVQANRSSARRALRGARDAGERSIARMIKAELHRCALCGGDAMKRGFACAGGCETYYCSVEHRRAHAARHGVVECADLSAAAVLDSRATRRFQLRAELFSRTREAAMAEAAAECEPCEEGEVAEVAECPVCYDEMGGADDAECTSLLCGHQFHADCIARWFAKQEASVAAALAAGREPPSQSTCPYCRAEGAGA